MPKVQLGDKKFATKKNCEEYVRDLVNNLPINELITPGNATFVFLKHLLSRHNEKHIYVNQVRFFVVRTNKVFKSRTLYFKSDSLYDSFSWNHCVRNTSPSPQTKTSQVFQKALRSAIIRQTQHYKKSHRTCEGDWTCSSCGVVVRESKNAHVDHVVEFSTLVKEFTSSLPARLDIGTLRFSKCPISLIRELEEPALLQQWRTYHSLNATLQMLCQTCNLSKPRRKV